MSAPLALGAIGFPLDALFTFDEPVQQKPFEEA